MYLFFRIEKNIVYLTIFMLLRCKEVRKSSIGVAIDLRRLSEAFSVLAATTPHPLTTTPP